MREINFGVHVEIEDDLSSCRVAIDCDDRMDDKITYSALIMVVEHMMNMAAMHSAMGYDAALESFVNGAKKARVITFGGSKVQ